MRSLFRRRAAAAPPVTAPDREDGACRNCGAPVAGAYCPVCGQETTIALPTLRAFLRDAAGRYVALDGRLWRTLYGLFFRPGFLTREFFAGRRRRYIRPARLFLVLSIVAFAALRFMASGPIVISDEEDEGIQVGGLHLVDPDSPKTPGTPKTTDVSAADAPKAPSRKGSQNEPRVTPQVVETSKSAARAAQGKGRAFDPEPDADFTVGPDLDLRVGAPDEPGLGALNERVQRFNRLTRQEKNDALRAGVLRFGPYAMIVLLPLFALLMKIAYLGRAGSYAQRPRRYTAHLVFGAHNHAFMFALVTIFALVDVSLIRTLLVLWAAVYLVRSMKIVYGGRWSGVVVRSAFVGFGYLIFFAIAVGGLVVAAALIR